MKAVKNIINRLKQFEPCFVEIFAGDDLKKDRPRNKIFDVNKNNLDEIINQAKIMNNGSYGVFMNINPLCQPKRLKANISKLLWVFIDLDDGASEDHNNLIKTNLEKWGFTFSYNAKSGHGYHFLVPIELDNNKEQIVKKFLTYLKENICEKVDVATFTNERLMRFPESIHNKDKVGKQLLTLHTSKATEEEIKNNSELIYKYQQEQKKGVKDSTYNNSIKVKDVFFNSISNHDMINKVYAMLNKHDEKNDGKGSNQIFNKNIAIFASQNKLNEKFARTFIENWNNQYVTITRFEHFLNKIKTGTLEGNELKPTVNYNELLKWSKEFKLKLFIPLLEEQTRTSFLDQYEIYYLEEEKKDSSYLIYYPEKNYFIQKSLNEMLQNIYYDSKENGINLVHEFGLDCIEDWENFSFSKQLNIILGAIHKKLDSENRIKIVYNINYEPTDSKFVYFENKKYFNTYVATELWDFKSNEKTHNFCYIKELIMNLCDNDDKNYRYFVKWLAWIIQNPTQKLPTAVIFQGEQGTGKGIFKTHILDNLFGSNVQEINQTHLESTFNSYLMGKQIIVANEVMHNENRQTLPNILKNLVTDPEITINRKFQKEIKGKNYTHWIFCTNSDNPIKIEEGDRRYSVFYSQKLKGGGKPAVKFVKKLQENLDFELKEFISYLKDIKVVYEDVHEPIMTEAKAEVIELNKDSTHRFIEYLKQFNTLKSAVQTFNKKDYEYYTEIINGMNYLPTDLFNLIYENYCDKFSERGKFNKQTFAKKIKKYGIISESLYSPSKKKSLRYYNLDTIEKNMEC